MPDTPHPQKPADRGTERFAKKAAPKVAADLGPDGVRHFSGTVLKRNADGETVMSDHLEEGDEVVRQGEPDDTN